MKKILNILLLFSSISVYADGLLFEKANKLYSEEKYSEAILLYSSILEKNIESSEIYYNIGNCFYKQENWPYAIWNYEKSLKIKKNKKTIHNLYLSNLKIIDKIEPLPELFYIQWWKTIEDLFTIYTWQLFALISIWIFAILKILEKRNSAQQKRQINILLIIFIICASFAYSSYTDSVIKKEAIIISSTASINSAPSEKSSRLFLLHSGTKIEIIDQIQQWSEIKIKNGNTGWIERNKFKEL